MMQTESNQRLIVQIQNIKENQKEERTQKDENIRMLVEQFITEMNVLINEIKELK